MTFGNSILGGINLIRAAIRSPNFVTGVSGWTINQDGSAEFNNITIRGGTTIGGDGLYYAGTPALGNLIFSISDTGGTDTLGNVYGPGFIAYGLGFTNSVKLDQGAVNFGIPPNFTNSAQIFQSLLAGGDLELDTGHSASDPDGIRMGMNAGANSVVTGDANVPHLGIIDELLTSEVDLQLSGSIVKTDISGNPLTWQSVTTYRAGWGNGTVMSGLGGNGLKYHIMPDDSLWMQGLILAAAGAGAFVMDLPADYRPITGTPHAQVMRSSGGVITIAEVAVTTVGEVILGAGPAVGDIYSFNFRIPLRRVP